MLAENNIVTKLVAFVGESLAALDFCCVNYYCIKRRVLECNDDQQLRRSMFEALPSLQYTFIEV